MDEVMQKAQALAEAILDSDVYQKMHTLELRVTKDEEATAAMSALIEKRHAVEDLLATKNMDRDALTRASDEMEAAETAMNAIPMITEMKEARKAFQDMMDNVNRILRLVITGEVEDTPDAHSHGGCTGDCAHCHSTACTD